MTFQIITRFRTSAKVSSELSYNNARNAFKDKYFSLPLMSRNSAVFYYKSSNLIGSLTVFYPLKENNRARLAL